MGSGGGTGCDVPPDFPTVARGSTAVFDGDAVRVCGGYDGDYTDRCYELDPGGGTWRESASMLEERYYPASSLIGNIWFISGGEQVRTDSLKGDCVYMCGIIII